MSIRSLILVFNILLFSRNTLGLLANTDGQNALQHEVELLRQKVAVLEQEVDKLKHPTVVAFLAELTGSYLTPTVGQHLIYSGVHLNTGNGYHQFHGVFIAPVSGVYCINAAATVSEGANKGTHINIKHNGNIVGYMFFDNLDALWLKNRESVVLHLNANDEIWAEVTATSGGAQIATGSMHTYFSGFLISQDQQ